MDFSLLGVFCEQACHDYLLRTLHPAGLVCPHYGSVDDLHVHRRYRAPVLDYRCGGWGCVFNAWTGTLLQGTQRSPAQWAMILWGIAQRTSTAQLARELGCSRRRLLDLRHRLQHAAWQRLLHERLRDWQVEADEM